MLFHTLLLENPQHLSVFGLARVSATLNCMIFAAMAEVKLCNTEGRVSCLL